MRFFAALFTVGALALGAEFAFVAFHRYGACSAIGAPSCAFNQHMLSIALLAFMAALAALGAIIGTRRHTTES